MDQPEFPILHNNPFPHIPTLRIDPAMFALRFSPGCSMSKCSSTCCKGGVWADVAEKERILNHIELVHKYMDPEQEHDPAKWFEENVTDDPDFPSGKAIGTQVVGKGCVFLDRNGLCVLQKAEIGEKNGLRLKPFYCFAFPITIVEGVVVYDDYMADTQPQCCSAATSGGELTVFDVFGWELEHTVGAEAYKEIKQLAGISA